MSNNQYVYLVKVEPNANNNKFYKMIQLDDNNFEVQYGRIGNSGYQSRRYLMSQWNKKLREKEKKGYVDQTRLVATPIIKVDEKKYLDIDNKSIAEIVLKLQLMAQQAIKHNYTVSSKNVTKVMIDEAQILINKLNSIEEIEYFNKSLVDLFKTIPRKMSRVSYYLAKNKNDFEKISQREQDLLDVMQGQVITQDIEKEEVNNEEKINKTILEAMGLKFKEVTIEEEKLIKKQLGAISDKYKNAWKVINLKTQEKYDKFIKENKIKNTKLLWHGSRSENFWSIINIGLVLRSNAIITGKLYGHGIYFAPKAKKSLGYTSLNGSYWAKGNNACGFMALLDVAYGKPYNVYDFNNKYYNLNYENLQKISPNSNCLHAHAGANLGGYSNLKNDEIVIYKEDQCTIKYLVELR